MVWRDAAWRDVTWHGMAWHDMARRGRAVYWCKLAEADWRRGLLGKDLHRTRPARNGAIFVLDCAKMYIR